MNPAGGPWVRLKWPAGLGTRPIRPMGSGGGGQWRVTGPESRSDVFSACGAMERRQFDGEWVPVLGG